MQGRRLTLPELALFAATRGMIGFGAGLLISEHLGADRRRAVGWTLLITGALSTIPFAIRLFRRPRGDAGRVAPSAGPGEVATAMAD